MKMSALIRIITVVILTALATIACQGKADRSIVDVASSSSLSNLTDCRTIQHEMGETEVCGQLKRIVVLGPYILEHLLALDVQPVAFADHVAFHQGDYTDPSQQIPYLGERITQPLANVGIAYTPSIEAIVKVQPDLILGIDDINANQYETLSKIAPTLLLDYSDTENTLKAIAKAVNRSEQAEQLLAKTQQQFAQARETFAPLVATHPKILLLGSPNLSELYLENPANSCSSLIEKLGFQRISQSAIDNANSEAALPLSLETLPEFNDADLVILFGSNFSKLKQFSSSDNFEDHQLSKLKQAWEENAIAQSLDASKAGRVYFIPAYLCRGLPGPIGTELYLEELKEQLLSPS
jgi:iron complex transport system substrate-binding protein